MRWAVVVALSLGLATRVTAEDTAGPAWQASFAAASAAAQKSNRPLLVKFGAPWCGWCQKLDEEFAKPEVALALSKFELATIDIDRDRDVARQLAVEGVPALRVLTPRGRLLASRDGFLSAADLVAWLAETARAEEAVNVVDGLAGLAATSPPGLLEVPRIAKAFGSRDVAIREAAISRLRPYPKESAAAVIAAFRGGNLQTRLAAIDLLRAWQAPTNELDPWRPETLTAERLAALDTWGRSVSSGPAAAAWEPTADELAAAVRDMDSSLTATATEAATIRERLAKFGPRLLPAVLEKLVTVEDDAYRERLYALRYRLVAAQGRVLAWPGGIERLASRDLKERRQAIGELIEAAAADDEALLSELASDPDPLVRELALRGLQETSGESANAALVKMLADPEPNVRAAVLKLWAEQPAASMLPELEKYLGKEKEADLVVHAVRVLRELGAGSGPLLIRLTKHRAWQVRAEAAEALAKLSDGHSFGPSFGIEIDDDDNDEEGTGGDAVGQVHQAFLNLLNDDDDYVASRAVEGLRDADLPQAVEPLLALAELRPELAPAAISVLASGTKTRAASAAGLRKFVGHTDPTVRAAALAGLIQNASNDSDAEILAGLEDGDVRVRIAVADGLAERAKRTTTLPVRKPFYRRLFDLATGSAGNPKASGALEQKSAPPDTPHTPLLRQMAASPDEDEAVAGAAALVATGFTAEVLGRLEALVEAKPSLIPKVSGLLNSLDAASRARMFRLFIKLDIDKAAYASYSLRANDGTPEPAVAELVWELCRDPRFNPEHGMPVLYTLEQAYLGHNPGAADRERLRTAARDRCQHGNVVERMVALNLLASAEDDDVLDLCRDILNADAVLDPDLSSLAFRIILLYGRESELRRAIAWGLETGDEEYGRPAIAGLAEAWDSIRTWEGRDGRRLAVSLSRRRDAKASAANPFDPAKPEHLTVGHLALFAESESPADRALEAYFRILLDDSMDIEPLVRLWEEQADNEVARRLLVRAIAYLDDPALIPVLDRVLARLKPLPEWERESAIKDFYWTIRIMNGPEIVAFRKRVREETGISIR